MQAQEPPTTKGGWTPLGDEPPRQKAYCIECRYYMSNRQSQTGAHCCWHPNATEIVDTWRGRSTIQHPPEERNATNDCPDFTLRQLTDFVHGPGAWQRIGFLGVLVAGMLWYAYNIVAGWLAR